MKKPLGLAISTCLCAATFALSTPARAADCEVLKLNALSDAVRSTLRCRSDAAGRGIAVDPACLTNADAEMQSAFTAAHTAGGCAASDDTDDVLTALHAFDSDLTTALITTSAADRCARAKLRATGHRASRVVRCRRKPTTTTLCLPVGLAMFTNGFERSDARGDCLTSGDATTIDDFLTSFLEYATARIDGTSDSEPSNLSAVLNGATINLSWTAPDPFSGNTHARLLRKLNAYPTGPTDPAATVVFDGAAQAATDTITALLPSTPATLRLYHYSVYGCDSGGSCESVGSQTTLLTTVKQALQAGGYVLHWRHASADVCADATGLGTAATTAVPDWWKSCDSNCGTATARQLNSTGRAESAAIGDAFATLGITVGRVVTSEFCRNNETASLMDFGPALEQSQELSFFVYDEASRCSDTFVMLGEVPAAGTNTALIGHAGNTCPPLSTLAWAEAAIYKPDGLGGATYIDRVLGSAWLSLP